MSLSPSEEKRLALRFERFARKYPDASFEVLMQRFQDIRDRRKEDQLSHDELYFLDTKFGLSQRRKAANALPGVTKEVQELLRRHKRDTKVHRINNPFEWRGYGFIEVKQLGESDDFNVITDVENFTLRPGDYAEKEWHDLIRKLDRHETNLKDVEFDQLATKSIYLAFRAMKGHPDGGCIVDVSPVNDFYELQSAIVSSKMNIEKTQMSFDVIEDERRESLQQQELLLAESRNEIAAAREEEQRIADELQRLKDKRRDLQEQRLMMKTAFSQDREAYEQDKQERAAERAAAVMRGDREYKANLSLLASLIDQVDDDQKQMMARAKRGPEKPKPGDFEQMEMEAIESGPMVHGPFGGARSGTTAPLNVVGFDKDTGEPIFRVSDRIAEKEIAKAQKVTDDAMAASEAKIQMLEAQLLAAEAQKETAQIKAQLAEDRMQMYNLTQQLKDWNNQSQEEKEFLNQHIIEEGLREVNAEDNAAFYSAADKLFGHLRGKMGSTLKVKVSRGHPKEMLALRGGVKHQPDKIDILLDEHLKLNNYLVTLPAYNVQIIACLDFDKTDASQLYIKTWMHPAGKRWTDIEKEVTGFTGKFDRGIDVDQYKSWNETISSQMHIQRMSA